MKYSSPPKLAEKLLNWLLKEELAEEVLGDLDEQFFKVSNERSVTRAKFNYWYQVFCYLRPFAIKKSKHSTHFSMFKNSLKIASRTMMKQKTYSFVKVTGFAIGIAACLLIGLFIRHELSYDKHFKEGEWIYRVVKEQIHEGDLVKAVWFPAPFAETIKTEFPEIEKSGRFLAGELFGAGSREIRRMDRKTNTHEEGFVFVDKELIEIFKPVFVYGDQQTALSQPYTIVLTKSKADKYFPGRDPVGQQMIVDEDLKHPLTIAGVIEDWPETSHFNYQFFVTLSQVEFWKGEQRYWNSNNYPTYVRLKHGVDVASLEKKMKSIGEKYYLPIKQREGEVNAEATVDSYRFYLQPISDIHLYSKGIYDHSANSDIQFVWMFGIIAIFILLLASINFINLSTAKSANRAKEVGVRKVMGSYKRYLVLQFLTESQLYSALSFVLGVFIALLSLPYFNTLTGKTLVFPVDEWWLFPSLLVASLVVGALSGLYPSFYLSSFKPVDVLKGKLRIGSKSSGLRGTLVVFQFTTSIVLIVSTLVIYRQFDFILNKELGFDKDQVLMIKGGGTLGERASVLKNELKRIPEVQNVSIGDYLPVSDTKRDGNYFWKVGRKKLDEPVTGQFWKCDEDYIQTLGMEVVSGRDFSKELDSDSTAIVNETMVRKLGLTDPVGKYITNGYGPQGYRIVGVVKDFHFETMKDEIGALCLVPGFQPETISVKINSADMLGVVNEVTDVWESLLPNQPIRLQFLDSSYELMYKDVKRTGYVFACFAGLAIIVACLGLFALSAFMVEQRAKEIGIRLVLGASISSIFNLLTRNFIWLIVISLVVATPVAWYLMNQWLSDYKYGVSITVDVFLIAGGMTAFIALATVSYESIKSGFMKPAETLKAE